MPWRLFGKGEKGPPSESAGPVAAPAQETVPWTGGKVTAAGLKARTILVPVDGSRASLEAVALACNLARRQRGKVYAIHVIEVPRTLTLDAELESEAAHGEDILRLAEQVAEGSDHGLQGELLQARDAGQAVVDEAVSRGVELIIMGMEYRRQVGGVEMGRLPQYVLRNAPCEVWVIRRPPPAEAQA